MSHQSRGLLFWDVVVGNGRPPSDRPVDRSVGKGDWLGMAVLGERYVSSLGSDWSSF